MLRARTPRRAKDAGDTVDSSSEIAMPLDSNASIDGRAVTAEYEVSPEAVRRATQRTYAVSKLLRPRRSAFGAASQTAVINHLISRQ